LHEIAIFLPASKLQQPMPFEVTARLQDSMMSTEKDKKINVLNCNYVVAFAHQRVLAGIYKQSTQEDE